MVIVSSALFNGIMFEVFSQLDRRTFVQVGAGLFVFLILLSGFFYAVFVFSPAQIADAKGSWTDWVIRYALFLVGSLVGISVLGAVRR